MRLAGVGDNVVDRYRELGLMFPGGQALNVAVHARRFGAESSYVGALGDDAAGRHVLDVLNVEQVQTDRIRIVHGPNAYGVVDVIEGDRVFVGGSAGVSKFRLDHKDLEYLRTFDLVHSSEASFLEDQIPEIARVARVSFDFSSHHGQDYIEPLLPHVAIAEFSISSLSDEEASDYVADMQRINSGIVLATRGAGGALLYDGKSFWRQAALPTKVVDTLGAGDAMTARFLVGILRGEPCDVALAAGAQAAAGVCRHYGALGYGVAAVPATVPLRQVGAREEPAPGL